MLIGCIDMVCWQREPSILIGCVDRVQHYPIPCRSHSLSVAVTIHDVVVVALKIRAIGQTG